MLVRSSVRRFETEIHDSLVIESIVNDITRSIELSKQIEENNRLRQSVDVSMKQIKWILKHLTDTKQENITLNTQYNAFRLKAEELRERVVAEIGPLLREERRVRSLYERIYSLEASLSDTTEELENLRKAQHSLPVKSPVIATSVAFISIIHELDGPLLLNVFSFLQTADILASAQVSKFIYAKVYKLFGIDSRTVAENWSIKPSATNSSSSLPRSAPSVASPAPKTSIHIPGSVTSLLGSPSSVMNSSSGSMSSKDFAEAMSKKLTAPELKTILNMTDKLKKQTQEINQLRVDKEDLSAKLQVRENLFRRLHHWFVDDRMWRRFATS